MKSNVTTISTTTNFIAPLEVIETTIIMLRHVLY